MSKNKILSKTTNATDSVTLMREWLYNNRSELASATIGVNQYGYEYDTIGNRLWSAANLATNTYVANSLNQYATMAAPGAPQTTFIYDADGNMTRDGAYTYAYGDGGPTWTFGKARTPKIEYPPKEGKK